MALLALAQGGRADWPRAIEAPGPTSFVERGVAVGCTTPALNLCRLRTGGRGHLEVVLPNLVDGRGIYVVPWTALPEIMSPTIHDRVLHEEIVRHAAIDPERIRLAQLEIAARGFAGTEAAAAASRLLAGEERVAITANLALMVELMHAGGLTSLEAAQAAASGCADELRRALDRVAGRVGITATELADRAAALSRGIAAIGLPAPQPPGRLRRLVARLGELGDAIQTWAEEDASDPGIVARHCGAVVEHVVGRCCEVLGAVDRRLASIVPTLRAWPRDALFFDESRLRLAWLLDGWQRAIVIWEEARERPRFAQTIALGRIFQGLSLLPAGDDADGIGGELARAHVRLMRRHSRLFDDWDAGLTGAELIRRIEKANLRAEFL